MKLLELADNLEHEAWHFEQLSYGGAHETIEDGELANLLTKINALDRGYLSTIEIMSMRLFEKEARKYSPSSELCDVARAALLKLVSSHREELKPNLLHRIDRIVEEVLGSAAPENEVKEIIDSLCAGIGDYRLYAFDMTQIITPLVRKYPEQFLNAIFNGSDNEEALAHLMFREGTTRDAPTMNDAPLDRVLAWCGTDQQRIAKVAKILHAYSVQEPSDASDENPKCMVLSKHIRTLLEIAQDKGSIVEVIFENANPSSWSGSIADIFEVRSKAFAELLQYPDPAVQALVKTKLALFEQRIHLERAREAVENNEREQRFE
ncbi:MAG: hypothetical protein EOP06_13520 [Proteobacteria bacterium]|nr:MAG: hypothetical protein EOP06_13520 [Pseudomonadota bacterium]